MFPSLLALDFQEEHPFQGGQIQTIVSVPKMEGDGMFQKIPNKTWSWMTKNSFCCIRNAMIIVDGELKSGHHQRMQKRW